MNKPDYETIIQRIKDKTYHDQSDVVYDLDGEFGYETTTSASNGYPQNLLQVITHPRKSALIELRDELRKAGIEVDEYLLNAKDGWDMPHRKTTSLDVIDFTLADDDDHFVQVDSNQDREQIEDEIYGQVYGFDHEFSFFSELEEAVKLTKELAEDIPFGNGIVTAFYDGVNGHNGNFLYVVTDDSAGYHDGDVTSYQLAIRIILPT